MANCCLKMRPLIRVGILRTAVLWQTQLERHLSSGTYRAVIFDMYGVLIPSPMPKAKDWEERSGVPRGTLGRVIRTGGERSIWKQFMRGELEVEEFLEAFNKECSTVVGFPVNTDSFLEALTSGAMRRPFPVMMEAIQELRAHGLKTAVLSNNFLLPNGESYLPLDKRAFNVIIESCQVGLCKPDPRIYQLCAEQLEVLPQEAVFLDDLPMNVEAAARLGMQGIQVVDPATAVGELEKVLQVRLSGSGFGSGASVNRKCQPQLQMEKLIRYLKDVVQFPDADSVNVQKISSGPLQSSYLLNSPARTMVLKLTTNKKAAEKEQRVLTAINGSKVPVPEVVHFCEDASVFGCPFLLLEVPGDGQVLDPQALADLKPEMARGIYEASLQTLCHIHSLEPAKVGLERYEPLEGLLETLRQLYKASPDPAVPAMERLIQWLPSHLPRNMKPTLVHGDFRLDNLVCDVTVPQVKAVLGWDQCSVGDPLMDVASLCMAHYLPPGSSTQRGGEGTSQVGVPDASEVFVQYSRAMGLAEIPHWRFYMALVLYRHAVHLRVTGPHDGPGDGGTASASGRHQVITQMAELAWDCATREGFRIFNALPKDRPSAFSAT